MGKGFIDIQREYSFCSHSNQIKSISYSHEMKVMQSPLIEIVCLMSDNTSSSIISSSSTTTSIISWLKHTKCRYFRCDPFANLNLILMRMPKAEIFFDFESIELIRNYFSTALLGWLYVLTIIYNYYEIIFSLAQK